MDRRRFLTGTGVAITIGTAGCGSPGGDGDGGGGDGGGGDGGQTPEAGETPEDDEAPGAEDEDTPEETPGEDVEDEEMNETGGNETEGNETDGEQAGGGGGGEEEVRMATEGEEYIFDPIGLHVEPGTTVTWTNESGSHSSTAYAEGNGGAEVTQIPEDAEPWDSGILSEEGATFEHTFETEGTYNYFCQPHKTLGMIARVVVGEPGGPGEDQPPDGEVPDSQQIVDQGSISYEEFQG